MALRDILVHVDHSPDSARRVRLAADLASRHRAHLTILHVRERSIESQGMLKAAELGLFSAGSLHRLEDEIEAKLRDEAERLRAASLTETDAGGVTGEFVSVAGSSESVVAQRARLADLTIVGHGGDPASDMPYDFTFGEAILFATGRPVLLVPPSPGTRTLGRRVALAWNGSRPAARALTDAMPILEQAEQVLVLTAHPVQAPAGAMPTEAMLTHLGRHCNAVSPHRLDLTHAKIAGGLQDEALRLDADLLVAGAYGHPKMWERLLGGVTRDLLSHTRLPLLMAH